MRARNAVPADVKRPRAPFPGSVLKWALAVWVLASLLFAHGCHGDEDHELFGVIEWIRGE